MHKIKITSNLGSDLLGGVEVDLGQGGLELVLTHARPVVIPGGRQCFVVVACQ